jgi:hypothetical protein
MGKDQLYRWQIYMLRHEAEHLGVVEAPDSDSAVKAAIKKFGVDERDRPKLFALRTEG